MSFDKKDRHFIGLTWDEVNPRLLFVDGKETDREEGQ
jgi:hypothetical protein